MTAAISRVTDYRVFLPGPVPVAAEVLAAMAEPFYEHRGIRYRLRHARLRELLRRLFQTRGTVLGLTCPATAAMELLSRQAVRPGRRVLHLGNGAFAERWKDISDAVGAKATPLFEPWGQPLDLASLETELSQGDVDAVAVTYSETSTGMLNPVQEIAAIVKRHAGVYLLVDAVSALAAVPLDFEEWGLDAAFAGVQKALACPPGFTVLAVSDRLVSRAAEIAGRGWLGDLPRWVSRDAENLSLATPSLAHTGALLVRLEHLLNIEGLKAAQARHAGLSAQTAAWTKKHLDLFIPVSMASPSLTTVAVPKEFKPLEFILRLREETGFVVGEGYGKLKASTFRIGHMGECHPEDLERLLQAMTSLV